jgi:poly(glycerol-phosphate) alpha-glucosyltransferase
MLDPWAVRNSSWKKTIAGWLYENEHLRGAACLHALCQSEAASIRAYGLDNPICVIPNAVELPSDQETENAPWLTSKTGANPVLLFLGRIHPKKGLSALIDAWEALGPSRGDWHLAIIGWDDGGHEEKLHRKARQLGLLDDTVHFLGPRFGDEKAAAFSQADAFILPSHSEGLPMAVLEAWSYGLPVLKTPACNIPEGFAADAAVRVEPNADAIATGLERLIAMPPAERAAMGERGRALVEERFTWPRVAEQMHAVYRWILGQREAPDCVIVD